MPDSKRKYDADCPSNHMWVAHRPKGVQPFFSDVICEATDTVIAAKLPNRTAMEIADCHNGFITPHENDKKTILDLI